jgi:hypothetical protein
MPAKRRGCIERAVANEKVDSLVVHPRRNGDGRCLANCSNAKTSQMPPSRHRTFAVSGPAPGAAGSGLNETLFLAPLPVYTGQVPVSRRHFSAMNETYLELGGATTGWWSRKKTGDSDMDRLVTAFFAPVYSSMALAFIQKTFRTVFRIVNAVKVFSN